MPDIDVQRTLHTIGLTCFVSNFEKLADESILIEDLVEAITSDTVSAASARTKAYAGRRVINTGNARAALSFVAESTYLDNGIAQSAKQILL